MWQTTRGSLRVNIKQRSIHLEQFIRGESTEYLHTNIVSCEVRPLSPVAKERERATRNDRDPRKAV